MRIDHLPLLCCSSEKEECIDCSCVLVLNENQNQQPKKVEAIQGKPRIILTEGIRWLKSTPTDHQMEGNLPTDYFLRQNMDEQGCG
ncbi:hypothetical protein LXL04_009419 [Taraxacum kok-saghyz]